MGFFNDIRSMFDAKFEGRYLGHIIKFTSDYDRQILVPLVGKAFAKSAIRCETEYEYKKGRRADLIVYGDDFTVLIEIKAEDGKSKGNDNQLRDYVEWLNEPIDSKHERKLVLLNKYHSAKDLNIILDELPKDVRKKKLKNITFSQYADELKRGAGEGSGKSSFIDLLIEYFSDEGLVMFEFSDEDSAAFISFMVLNFLPHTAGHGKQATQKKIARGPQVFTQLVQNWQLVSEQFAERYSIPRIPTVRYWSHQEYKKTLDLAIDDPVLNRREIRKNKNAGMWTIYSDAVVSDALRLEFGIEYSIETKQSEVSLEDANHPINVSIYSAFRLNRKHLVVERKSLSEGIDSTCLKSSLDLTTEISKLTQLAIKKVIKNTDDLQLRESLSKFDEDLRS